MSDGDLLVDLAFANCPDICEQAVSQLCVKCLQDKRRVMEVILVANCYMQFLIDQVSELYVRTIVIIFESPSIYI